MKKIILFLLAIFLLLAGCPQQEETIKIGFVGPLTGDAASYGQVEKDITLIAVEEINESGGINGKTLEVIYEDGKCSGKDAATAAQKLINIDKVKVILGGACSGETLAMAPIAENAKVIVFSSYSSSPKITNSGDYIFRNSYSDADSGIAAAELIAEKYKTVGILSENTEFAQAYKEVFKKEFEKKGGKILADEVYMPEARDFRTQLLKIMEAKPEAIWFDPQTDVTGGNAVKQAKELGFEGAMYGNFAFEAPGFLELAGEAAEGIIFAADPVPNGAQKDEVLKKYKERYNKEPAYLYPVGARYDSVYIIAQAIREVGYDADKIKQYLYDLENYSGALGVYGFDDNGDVEGVEVTKKVIKNGKIVAYEGS